MLLKEKVSLEKNRLRVILTFLMLFGPEALVVGVGVLTGN